MTDELLENLERYQDLLEDGEAPVPMLGFRLLVFLDANGEEQRIWKVDGIVRAATLVGHLETAKLELWARHIEDEDLSD